MSLTYRPLADKKEWYLHHFAYDSANVKKLYQN